jgi:hypothetical protein
MIVAADRACPGDNACTKVTADVVRAVRRQILVVLPDGAVPRRAGRS